MKCPVDGNTLLMTDRQSVEIDYCPECRGVWLDRGELDKLLRRDADDDDDYDDDRERDRARARREGYVYDERSGDWGSDTRYGKKKKKGWLSDIFEFGD
jgi:uncharacterized protein